MTIAKSIIKVWSKMKPVYCRRCGGRLYGKTERARGISNKCRKLEIEEKANSKKEDTHYFFTMPNCKTPSPMYLNLGDLLKSPLYTDECKIWIGDYDAPVLLDMYINKEKQ